MPDEQEEARTLLREQWGHAVETIRYFAGLEVQVLGFLAAANAAILAIGLSRGAHQALFVAAVMPLLMIAAGVVVASAIAPILYTAVVSEKELGGLPGPLMTTFVEQRAPLFYKAVLTAMEQDSAGKEFTLPPVIMRGRLVFWALAACAVIQFGLAVLLNT